MSIMMKKTLMSALTLLTISSQIFAILAKETPLKPLWTNTNVAQPESAIENPAKKVIYVSNINGSPMEKDGNGYISLLKKDGKTITQKWVTGLDAPKGLAQFGKTLYVADLTKLVAIDVNTGKITATYDAPQAKMLNDIAIDPDGVVYVSDLIGGGIYQLKDNQFGLWLNTPEMRHPNGLLWFKDQLYTATWGLDMQADFSTKTLGSLYSINAETKISTLLQGGAQLGNLDGLTICNGVLVTNDWINGKVFSYRLNQTQKAPQMANLVTTVKAGLADISCTGKVLYAPMMNDNSVTAYTIPKLK